MLTKDLIRCRIRSSGLLPVFIDPGSPALLDLAARLLEVFRGGVGGERGLLEEQLDPLRKKAPDLTLAKALVKLLEDRAVFAAAGDLDYFRLRREIFHASAKLYRDGGSDSPERLRERLRADLGDGNPLLGGRGLYADLPDHDVLERFRDLTPRQLLERYNLGLVQGLLLTARRLGLRIRDAEPQRLRRLFKYLRFFRLLARISCPDAPVEGEIRGGVLELVIDGPAGVLEQSRRYGLQLASFFPAVCSLKAWELTTEVLWKGRERTLRLDQTSPLTCPYRSFGAYVPDEIRLFHRHFRETVREWEITGETPFLRGPGEEVVFPDLSFRRNGRDTVHLELFHRWHRTGLLAHLRWLEGRRDLPVVVGIDRALLRNDPELTDFLDGSGWFAERGFVFKDYPTVRKTLDCLRRSQPPGDAAKPPGGDGIPPGQAEGNRHERRRA